jgi:hypothetical protein
MFGFVLEVIEIDIFAVIRQESGTFARATNTLCSIQQNTAARRCAILTRDKRFTPFILL